MMFTPAELTVCVNVSIIDDNIFDPGESFVVELTPIDRNVIVVNKTLSETEVFITDDDGMLSVKHVWYYINVLNAWDLHHKNNYKIYYFSQGPVVTFLNEPYEVIEENGTLEICFNITRNAYLGDLNYTFIGMTASGMSMGILLSS